MAVVTTLLTVVPAPLVTFLIVVLVPLVTLPTGPTFLTVLTTVLSAEPAVEVAPATTRPMVPPEWPLDAVTQPDAQDVGPGVPG